MEVAASKPDYPPVIFFYQAGVDEGREFFDRYWPEARAVSDPKQEFYRGFGLERGGIRQLFAPEVWVCGLRAAAKGHFIGAPAGDPFQMPGLFLAKGSSIVWKHDFKHAGDHPDFASITQYTRG